MKNANAATVRTWLASNGGAGARGRIKASDADRFNKAHKGKAQYVPQGDAEKTHIEVPGVVSVDKAGRKVTKTVTILTEQGRSLLGHQAGKRGRFSKATLALALSAQNADAVADTFTK